MSTLFKKNTCHVKCIAKVIAQKTMLCGDENKLKLK